MAMKSTCVLLCLLLVGTQATSSTECDGGLVNGYNVPYFAGCTRVSGNIVINSSSLQSVDATSQLLFDQLEALSNIQEITGYLLIENLDNYNFTNLRFLRNLMVIQGEDTVELRPGQHYSLVVSNNPYLETANFGSLLRIVDGGVRITNNPELCLIDTITVEQFLVNSDLRRIGGLGQDCNEFACHVECNIVRGCWGTLADECVECSNYQYQGTCVPTCNLSISYVNETSFQCVPFPSNTQSEEPSTSIITTVPVRTTMIPTTAAPSVETPPPSFVTMTTTLATPNGKQPLNTWVIALSITIAIICSTSTIGIAITVYICHRKKSKHSLINKSLSKRGGSLIRYSENNDKLHLLQNEENSLQNTRKQKRQRVSLSALARENGFVGNKRNSDSEPIDISLHSRPCSSDLEDHMTSHAVHMTAHDKHMMIAQRASKILTHQSSNDHTVTTTQITMPSSKGENPQYLTSRDEAGTSPKLSSSHKPNFQQQTQWPMAVGGVYPTRHAHNSYTMRRGSSSHGTSTRTSFSSYRHSMTSNSGMSSVRTVVSNHGSESSLPVSPDQDHSPRVM